MRPFIIKKKQTQMSKKKQLLQPCTLTHQTNEISIQSLKPNKHKFTKTLITIAIQLGNQQ